MNRKFRTLAALAATALALSVAGCAGTSEASAPEENPGPVTVRAGWVPTIHSTHWATTGQFADETKVKIELSPFKTNNEMFVAMQSGSLDMMTMGYNNTIAALDRGSINFTYVAGTSEGGTRILVRDGVEIESWADLKGMRVGTSRGSTQHQQLVLAAKAHDIDIDTDTEFTNIGGAPDMLLALQGGSIDVVAIWEPQASQGIVEEYAHEVPALSDTFYDDSFKLNSGLAVSNDFLANHGDAVEAALAGYEMAWEKVTSDEAWWVDEFMKLSSSDRAALELALNNITPVTTVDAKDIEHIAKSLFDAGMVTADHSADVSSFLAPSAKP